MLSPGAPARLVAQPRYATEIDPSEPLTKGLVGFWYPASGQFISAVPGVSGVSPKLPFLLDPKGLAAGSRTAPATPSVLIPHDTRWKPTAAMTFITEGVILGTVGGYGFSTEGSSNGYGQYETGGTIHNYLATSAGFADVAITGASLGLQAQHGFQYDGATFRNILNGATNSTQAIAGTIVHSTNPLYVGCSSSTTGLCIHSNAYIAIWNRALSASELRAFRANPWRVLLASQSMSWITLLAAGTTPISGTATLVDGADTIGSSGNVAIVASATLTDGADVISATGNVATSGSATLSDDVDTISAAGNVAIVASAALTDGVDTISAAATTPAQAASSLIDGPDTISASGMVVGGSAAVLVDSPDTMSSTGALPEQASANLVDGANTFAATGALADNASSALTDGANGFTAAGSVTVTGSATLVDGADSISSTGNVGYTGINASSTLTDGADTMASTGVLAVVATSVLTDGQNALTAAGGVSAGASATLVDGAAVLGATAQTPEQASATLADGADVFGSTVSVPVPLNAAAILVDSPDTLLAVGNQPKYIVAAMAEGSETFAATAVLVANGTASMVDQPDNLVAAVVGPPRTGVAVMVDGQAILLAFAEFFSPSLGGSHETTQPANDVSVSAQSASYTVTTDVTAYVSPMGSNQASA